MSGAEEARECNVPPRPTCPRTTVVVGGSEVAEKEIRKLSWRCEPFLHLLIKSR